MSLPEEGILELSTTIIDLINLKDIDDTNEKEKIVHSSFYEGVTVTKGFLNISNPFIFVFNNEHDNDLFKTFLITCIVDYTIHKLSFPEIKFNLDDSKETNREKILNLRIDPEQLIVLVLLRIKSGQHLKCLSLEDKYYSITEKDNDRVCTGFLKNIFDSIVVREKLLSTTLDSFKTALDTYLSYNQSQQFTIVCNFIDKSGIWDDNRLDNLTTVASQKEYSPARYLFGKLYTRFLSVCTQYPSSTIHRIVLLFEYYDNRDIVEYDEKTQTYVWTEKFILSAKEIVDNVHIYDKSTIRDKSKMEEIEMNILNFSKGDGPVIQ